jgi:hypothetical protein
MRIKQIDAPMPGTPSYSMKMEGFAERNQIRKKIRGGVNNGHDSQILCTHPKDAEE